jgi:hypothetical protein
MASRPRSPSPDVSLEGSDAEGDDLKEKPESWDDNRGLFIRLCTDTSRLGHLCGGPRGRGRELCVSAHIGGNFVATCISVFK